MFTSAFKCNLRLVAMILFSLHFVKWKKKTAWTYVVGSPNSSLKKTLTGSIAIFFVWNCACLPERIEYFYIKSERYTQSCTHQMLMLLLNWGERGMKIRYVNNGDGFLKGKKKKNSTVEYNMSGFISTYKKCFVSLGQFRAKFLCVSVKQKMNWKGIMH